MVEPGQAASPEITMLVLWTSLLVLGSLVLASSQGR